MFSGGDSSSTQQQQIKPTKNYQTTTTQQWSLNPSAYQNIANDQVDWAALAQQWIQMKETYPPDLLSNAPPPPSFFSKDIRDYEEKGEAPMEVEKDDEHQSTTTTSSVNSSSSNTGGSNLLLNGTATAWNAPANHNSTAWNASFTGSSTASQWRWSGWPDSAANTAANQNDASRVALLPTPTVYSIVPTANANALNSDQWSSSSKSRFSSSDHHHHHHHHHSSRHKDDSYKSDNEDHDDDDLMQTLDAAKRKTLPAWIREGLEKMEREKLKQEEKERERREREAILLERRKAEEEALKELEKESLIPKKSKFDSDSEDEYETATASSSTIIKPYTRMKSATIEQPAATATAPMGKIKYNDYNQRSKSPELNYKTRDELIQELMLAVRKNLTEILLEVTNEEILAIALETCTKAKKKAPTAQAMRKTTLTSSLSGGLGLGIYDDSSDSGSDSDDEKDFVNDKNDSDIELQETIKRRKQSFEKISREIEAQIAEQEEREERRREREIKKPMEDDKLNRIGGDGLTTGIPLADSFNDGKRNFFYDKKDGGEPQLHDKNLLKYGRSRREKKPSRFSDPKDIVKNVQTHIQILTSQQKLDSHKDEIDCTKLLNIDKGYRQGNDSNSSSSEESSSHHKDLIKKLVGHHTVNKPVKYNDHSDESVSSADEITSHRSSSRRSDRSEESRSSYRRERSSRSRSRDYYKSKSTSRDYRGHQYHRRRRDSRDRDYDRKRRDRSRSHSYDSKTKYKNRDGRSKSKDQRSSKSRSRDIKSSSRHKY